jgi:FAD dependent oxidoreductase.
MLAPVSEALFGEGALLRVNLLALARFPSFAAELEQVTGHRVGLRREGTLAVAFDAGDYAALTRLTAFRRSAGLEAEELDSRACRKLESFLTPDVTAGCCSRGTGRSTTGGTRRRCVGRPRPPGCESCGTG